jgi:SET domain-containing protein
MLQRRIGSLKRIRLMFYCLRFFALHDILPGQELTLDYGYNEKWPFVCKCEEAVCRNPRIAKPLRKAKKAKK